MRSPSAWWTLISSVLLLCTPDSGAQIDPALNMVLRGRYDQANNYADVWGEGDYAYVAHYGKARVTIVDISDPDNPTLAALFDVAPPDDSASAQDLKVHDGLLFVGLEGGGSAACLIVDVRDPTQPTLLTRVTVGSKYAALHNLFYDASSGFLYLANADTNSVGIVDLRAYDPDNPPATITSLFLDLLGVGGQFVHDITVQNGRLYAAAWDSLQVYDVANLGTQAPRHLGSKSGINVHSAWATDDGRFVLMAEEHVNGPVKLMEVREYSSTSIGLVVCDNYKLPYAQSTSVHNPVVRGDFVYISHYQAGVHVVGIDRQTRTLELVASYDTYSPAVGFGFAGCWGVYPLLGSDRILASDITFGLHVLQTDTLISTVSGGTPLSADLDGDTELTMHFETEGAPLLAGSVQLVTRLDGGPETITPMVDLGGGDFSAPLTAPECGLLTYHVRAQNTLGTVFTEPTGAPAESHSAAVVTGLNSVFSDDFQQNLGWSVSNDPTLTTGGWLRADPVGTAAQPESDSPAGTGTLCYFTGQGSVGGSATQADVDGAWTILTSPPLDFSAGDGQIRYAYWAFNDDATDSLVTEVSSNGTTWAAVEVFTGETGGWRQHAFRVSDFVTPGPNVRVRFRTADHPDDSITECAIDDVVAEVFVCEPPVGTWTDLGGGSPGGQGIPLLALSGPQTDLSLVQLQLTSAPPGAAALLWIALSSTPISILGGTLHANPFVEQLLLFTDGSGALAGSGTWPPGLPAQTSTYWQFLCADGSVPAGIILSNGVLGTTP